MRRAVLGLFIFGALASGGGVLWFNNNHVGLMLEEVHDVGEFMNRWESLIAASNLQHPAVVHWLPNNCPCTFLTMNHAQNLSAKALEHGFHVYHIDGQYDGLGASITNAELPSKPVGALVAVTHSDGSLAYLGAYSDGVRCNEGNSLVDRFIFSEVPTLGLPIVALDAKTCVC